MLSLAVDLALVEFHYQEHSPTLKLEKFQIAQGERVFLYGPSGSGKSTLLSLIAGVLPPQKGKLNVLGHDLSVLSSRARDKIRGEKAGYVFQNFNLLPYLTVAENIILPGQLHPKRMGELSMNEELSRLAQHLGLTSFLQRPVTALSVGQQQRVALARALLGRPQLMIADEPTSALDEEVTQDFMKLLLQECEFKKLSVLFVSHDRRLASFFDRQISLPEINHAYGVKQ